jgi:hypothetical protein
MRNTKSKDTAGPTSLPTIEATTQPSTAAPAAATVAELRATLPGVDSDFILRQLEIGATLAAATNAWIVELNSRNAKLQQELAAMTARPRQRG